MTCALIAVATLLGCNAERDPLATDTEGDIDAGQDATADASADATPDVREPPCLLVTPTGSFDFGPVAVGVQSRRTFEVSDCRGGDRSTSGQRVASVRIEGDDDQTFAIEGPTAGDIRDGAPLVFDVVARPGAARRSVAELAITPASPELAPLRVDLAVSGAGRSCPVARATCAVDGSSTPPQSNLRVAAGAALTCTSDGSFDPDGTSLSYRWSVASRPAASFAEFERGWTANPTIALDAIGTYEFTLTVTDLSGCESVSPASVTAEVRSAVDVYVELEWEVGREHVTDLDLHLLNPLGCWTESRWDCHFRSSSPDWGVVGDPADDPLLLSDADGVLGAVEAIRLEPGAVEAQYRIGVHHFGGEPATATVRVFSRGDLWLEQTREGLQPGAFWEVATFDWPARELVVVDQVYPQIEEATCE